VNQDPNDTENREEPKTETKLEEPEREDEKESRSAPGNLREVSYIVLFVAAVFTVNAMETGSYRTPWPVAVLTALAGIALFVYSWRR
jgi:hypothetical protein